ncbi:MAG: ATP-binding protein [Planctomycetes bacterium]|nr:ATP-binding protein [Planctomycetota bacterium]
MRVNLLRRLIRQLADSPQPDLRRLAEDIVVDEERLGHAQVARELKTIMEKGLDAPDRRVGAPEVLKPLPNVSSGPGGSPVASRDGAFLGVLAHPENLRSAMVLPSSVDAQFRRIETEYTRRDELAKFGLRPRRRILLHGPPGCGKTLGAERLAHNLGLQLYKVHFDAVVSSYLGETATNLRKIFDACRTGSRLLLLDECDTIASSRTGDRQDVGEMARTVNALLDLVESFDGPGLLVATTNLYSRLDHAIFRRFDDIIEIPKPGLNEIEQLLRLHLSNLPLKTGFPFKKISKSLEHSSAARVVRVAEESAKDFVLEGNIKALSLKHIESAIAHVPKDGIAMNS